MLQKIDFNDDHGDAFRGLNKQSDKDKAVDLIELWYFLIRQYFFTDVQNLS